MTGFTPPSQREIIFAVRTISPRQKKLLAAAAAVFLVGLVGLLYQISNLWLKEVPAEGGRLTEGVIGSPRFVNPLLAASAADRDLTALIYSGLVRLDKNGGIIPDLAKSYEVSPDGLNYTFTLKDDLRWHDGAPLTAADIEFTIQKVQDPLIKSPKRVNFEGVKMEREGDRVIRFSLRQPYGAFLENLTLGILPKHIWNAFDAEVFPLNQFNTESVGSGPYQIKKVKRNSLGIPEYYDLTAFNRFALGRPKISELRVRFYPGEDELKEAFRSGEIESVAALPAAEVKIAEEAARKNGVRLIADALPRVFGVFFNQNKSAVLADKNVRQALDAALDKELIINKVLNGYGRRADGPLPLSTRFEQLTQDSTSTINLAGARELLTKNGWVLDEKNKIFEKKTKKGNLVLNFSLATADTPELKSAAELIKEAWEKLGAKVELKIFEIADLNQNIIRPRQYDALFFGEVIGRRADLFSFWHSSQRLDPGLNIAMYTNLAADKILESLRQIGNTEESKKLYQDFEKEVAKDLPAIFVYSPAFLYFVPAKLQNVSLAPISTPADRFLNIYEWYSETIKVWKIFTD